MSEYEREAVIISPKAGSTAEDLLAAMQSVGWEAELTTCLEVAE